MPDSVNLNPSSFAEDGGLLDLSMEEVVSLFLDKEKRRHKEAKEDENQQEVVIGSRVIPMGLMMTLDSMSRRCNVSRALLTRCLSHQIVAWFEGNAKLKELSELFYLACDAADDLGYPDLYEGMRDVGYSLCHVSPKPTAFRTIGWVRNGLHKVAQPLGLPVGILFAVGLCQSVLTTDSGRSQGTIEKYLSEEVSQFQTHIEDRFIRVYAFHDTVRRRAKSDGKTIKL
ncbi:hypothetical protein LCGC14_0411850 [marine sediment metagenome]|uniref:Uncharacterized protein n=1 Tax=marine sediment metagenome TaxID=412755 RepID=A0A0F9W2U3_9ZZZZ